MSLWRSDKFLLTLSVHVFLITFYSGSLTCKAITEEPWKLIFHEMEWDVVTSWQLRSLCGNYGIYVAVTGCMWQPSSKPRNSHVYPRLFCHVNLLTKPCDWGLYLMLQCNLNETNCKDWDKHVALATSPLVTWFGFCIFDLCIPIDLSTTMVTSIQHITAYHIVSMMSACIWYKPLNSTAALLNLFELEAHFKCGIFFGAHHSKNRKNVILSLLLLLC